MQEVDNIKSLAQQLEEFYNSLDAFDEENSLMKYDKALILGAITSIKRIEKIRRLRDRF